MKNTSYPVRPSVAGGLAPFLSDFYTRKALEGTFDTGRAREPGRPRVQQRRAPLHLWAPFSKRLLTGGVK